MFGIILILFLILLNRIEFSEELFSNPDLTNPLIPLRLRKFCGLRYSAHDITITYKRKCFIGPQSDNVVAYNSGYKKKQPNRAKTRILEGVGVEKREAPWNVEIALAHYDDTGAFLFFTHSCMGVLLTMQHILTAAHCNEIDEEMHIFAGEDDPMTGFRTRQFRFIEHPGYKTGRALPDGTEETNNDYDIAIIKLDEPLPWKGSHQSKGDKHMRFNTVCLPLPEEGPFSNAFQNATFYGWGHTGRRLFQEPLQKGTFMVAYCDDKERTCFGTPENIYPQGCEGDSGGGLVQYTGEPERRAVLIGILTMVVNRSNETFLVCNRENVGGTKALRVVKYLAWINLQLTN